LFMRCSYFATLPVASTQRSPLAARAPGNVNAT
jgi:hypothetical protein